MKYKILEKPNCEKAYELVEEAMRKRATIILFACCKVEYEGRALSQLNWGERIILIKPDGSFLIHQDKKVEPVNWQPPKSKTRSYLKGDRLILESHRRTPKELLSVEVRQVQFINYANVEDFEELEQAGYEKDMSDMIMKRPHIIEEGFTPKPENIVLNTVLFMALFTTHCTFPKCISRSVCFSSRSIGIG